ncbi:hypothetical protein Vretimale_12634 [Volvox reticuliferus]|uniref:J domain-containing protein n=1 Tax=Volvox reticuliferus TaxID=1737510 RepID=A0A8J4LSR0_9CHLO|nr:hypothetical protein Vretifemale_200 [Volvox reticuliferus]GIM08613.1 hypothetical protein Vretimale_12634 [Volvox reticuliferus]
MSAPLPTRTATGAWYVSSRRQRLHLSPLNRTHAGCNLHTHALPASSPSPCSTWARSRADWTSGVAAFPSTRFLPGSRHDPRGSSLSRRSLVPCAAYGRGRGGDSSDPNYYELLGVEPDCDDEDIRAAFRRRAKELHPDVNKEEGATEAFVQLSRAYEILSDAESRRQYDITYSTRRLNFFRGIVEDDDDLRRSPFRWSQVGQRRQRQQQGGGGPMRGHGDDWGGDDAEDDAEEDDEEDDGEEDDEEESPGRRKRSQEEMLEELAKFMSGSGSLRAWQSGRLDPWGTSTSDTWFRQVEKQTRNPYGPSRPGYGSLGDEDDDSGEWSPSRRVPGWSPPGRGSEWTHPRRQWDGEDSREGGPGGGNKRGGGGGGDFRRPFKI